MVQLKIHSSMIFGLWTEYFRYELSRNSRIILFCTKCKILIINDLKFV
jgi:hypothetical protein